MTKVEGKAAATWAVVVLLVSACGPKPQSGWTLFVYPAGMMAGSIITPGFKSKGMCLFAGREAVAAYGASRSAKLDAEGASQLSFECGRNCGLRPQLTSVAVCKETAN